MIRFIEGVIVGILGSAVGWDAIRKGVFCLVQLIQEVIQSCQSV
jgi:hypothetical protein